MYLLINSDNSVNYGNDHPVDHRLNFDGVELLEFPEKTLAEVVGDILPHEAFWDRTTQTVVRGVHLVDNDSDYEHRWRDKELQRVLNKMDQYERDQRIDPSFRTSKLSEYQYTELLRYRKKLCEYPETSNFKLKTRPTLNT